MPFCPFQFHCYLPRSLLLVESLRNDYYALRKENDRLRGLVTDNLAPEDSAAVLATCFDPNSNRANVSDIDNLAAQVCVDDNSAVDEEQSS